MLTNENLQLLAAEIAEVDRMIEELSPGAITARRTLQNRQKALKARYNSLAEQPDTAAFVQLLFSGGPVVDTRAIDAAFAADALWLYQDILTKATAVNQGGLGKRGVVAENAANKARLLITGVTRGSFGFTLEENLEEKGAGFIDSTLKTVVADVSTKMSSFCAPNEEEYNTLVEGIDKRLFASFKSFFKLLHDEEAEMKVLGRGSEKKFDTDGISRAFARTKSTKVIEHERQITGTLWGITPIDNTFNFLSNNNITYTGKLVPTFGLEYRSQVNRSEFYQAGSKYSAHIVRRTTSREGGTPHEAFFLVSLSAPDNPALPDTPKWRKT